MKGRIPRLRKVVHSVLLFLLCVAYIKFNLKSVNEEPRSFVVRMIKHEEVMDEKVIDPPSTQGVVKTFKVFNDGICCIGHPKPFLLCMSNPHPATRYYKCRAAKIFSPEISVQGISALPPPSSVYYNYPYDTPSKDRPGDTIVMKMESHINRQTRLPPIADHGILFHAYSSNGKCDITNSYVKDIENMVVLYKSLSPRTLIAVVSNCDLSPTIFRNTDIIIPVHPDDIIPSNSSQFTTRTIYNMVSPFEYSLIMDSHVIVCQKGDVEEVFKKFRESRIDIAYSTRELNKWVMSGFAILVRNTPETFHLWRMVNDFHMKINYHTDDQYGIYYMTEVFRKEGRLSFRWLSNNWFFASHGVDEGGNFGGSARAYRSSVLVNGRVRFIHTRDPRTCAFVNGAHGEEETKLRTFYIDQKGQWTAVHSQEQMKKMVGKYKAPLFDWRLLNENKPNSLFWFSGM